MWKGYKMRQSSNYRVPFLIWDIAYPFFLYYAVLLIGMFLGRMLFGAGPERYMSCQILASLIAIPVMYLNFYRFDKKLYAGLQMEDKKTFLSKKEAANAVCCMGIALLFAFSLNNLLSMTPLVKMSAGYAEANQNFYAAPLLIQLVGSGILTPILEELVFRGIIFARLKRILGNFWISVVLSALIFALIHANIVQFIYAFALGIVLALLMERTGHFYGAAAGHMAANLFAVIRTQYQLFSRSMDKTIGAWGISLLFFVLGMIALYFYWRTVRPQVE